MEELETEFNYDVWTPRSSAIILGRSCIEKDDICLSAYQGNISIMRRCGGGGTVFIDDGILIIDLVFANSDNKFSNCYFQIANKFVIDALKKMGINAVSDSKNYDLVINDKKFGGVSIYKRKKKVLYGASIIIKEKTIKKINNYINLPKKQPIYRRKRNHSDFLIALEQFKEFDEKVFKKNIRKEIIEYRFGGNYEKN